MSASGGMGAKCRKVGAGGAGVGGLFFVVMPYYNAGGVPTTSWGDVGDVRIGTCLPADVFGVGRPQIRRRECRCA
jgi:hypothetical protein